MDSATARKYLSGEVSIEDLSQPSSTETNPDPSSTGNPTTGDGGNDQTLDTSENSDDDTSRTATSEDETHAGSTEDTKANPSTEETNDTSNSDDKNKDTAGQEEFLEGKKDKRLPYPKAKADGKKPKDLAQIKANEAFIRQKHKYKAKVADLENQISSLKAQLMKYNAVNTESLKGDVDKLTDLKVAKGLVQNQIGNLEAQRSSVLEDEAMEQANMIHDQRVAACFDNESDVEHYHTLLENGRDKFVDFLSKVDPENAVLNYLDDCDISPLMVRVLMTNPQVLRGIIEKRNPLNKVIELRNLENRLNLDRKLRSVKSSNTKPAAKKLPSTGSQTKPGGGNSQTEVRDSNYWRNYLATHS